MGGEMLRTHRNKRERMNPRGNPQNLIYEPKLTPTQRLEVIAWYKAKRMIGTYKTKAREMNVTPSALSECIYQWREREGGYVRARKRRRRVA